ncbi:hypothetical protein H181DRAFT_00828 [Streptomyces sp. WMMB 714]|uniref:DUF6113 family protein n=1 Tax=Streptomyces sp. WMMB 714 TaxID=1286822 RepID=UPI000823B97B|nr:DUF6113 family protein [Streptomyces sp. WMMB 714]SCK13329.1 hypothetical protein H181DRAFT_00828 [Streptomyces sp. WMMB 714]
MSGGSADGGAGREQRDGGRDPVRPRGGQSPDGWPQPVPAGRAARLGVYAVLLVLGVVAGVAGSLVQSGWFPGGLLLALAGAVGLFWGGGKLCRTRVGAAVPAAGWTVTVVLLTTARPEGDFLFGAGIGSYVFLLGGMLAAVMCATIALPAPPVPGHKYR